MKRYGYLFEKICDIENLKLAHKNARKGKTHYKEVKMVDADIDKYILEIQDMLLNMTFTTSNYKVFTKSDKGKERVIYSLPYYPDRIIQHAIMQILEPIWKPTLIRTTYQSIKGRGIHKAKKDLERDVRKYKPNYYAKLDIKKFYPSISNSFTKKVIRKKIKDKKLLWLLDDIIDSCEGIPIGNYISQYLGNIVLSGIDHYVKEVMRIKQYYRYCDDIIIASKTKEELHTVISEVKNRLDGIRLSLKSNYQIYKLDVKAIDFVGYRIGIYVTRLRRSIAKSYVKSYKNKNYDKIVHSYKGWVKHCNCSGLENKVVNKRRVYENK